MAEFELPRTWGGKLKTAIMAINDELETVAAGGVAVVRKRFGPYRVEHDTVGFQTDPGYFVGITLDAGTIIEDAWLEGVEGFHPNGGGQAFIAINVNPVGDPDGYFAPVLYDLIDTSQSLGSALYARPILDTADTIDVLPVRLKVDAQVRVSGFFENGLSPEQGIVDLYVLISEPA